MANIIDNENVAFFDIDDTLILHPHSDIDPNQYKDLGYLKLRDSYEKGHFYAKPSKIHIKLLKDYRARGFHVVVWSGNGHKHALNVIEQLGLVEYVHTIMTKPRSYIDDLQCQEWMGAHLYLEKSK